jgi:hypothetical protein
MHFQVLTDAAPAAMLSSLRPSLEKALTGVPLLEDRPATLVAIECFMALICSGHIFDPSGTSHFRPFEYIPFHL